MDAGGQGREEGCYITAEVNSEGDSSRCQIGNVKVSY